MKVPALALSLCLVILTACGGGGNESASSGDLLSGNWQIVLQLSPTALKTESGFIVQSGQAVTGQFVIGGQTVCAGLGSAQGKVSGSNVALTINQVSQTVGLKGTTVSDGSSMSGDYSILSSGCGVSQTGTWTADRVKTLKGSYTGMFTSTPNPSLVFDIATTVSQGANTGLSTSDLSGTMNSTTAPCFTSLAFSGLISGTSLVFNLLDSNGAPVGQFRATASTDATTLTGNYQFNAQPNICAADFGTGTLSLQ
jgi:hypothetical protein